MAELNAEKNSRDAAALAALMDQLCSSSRRTRQEASGVIADISRVHPELLVGYMEDLVDALDRPEAKTRWEILDALSEVAAIAPQAVAGAYDGAENSLFDEDSATVRLAAFKLLSRYGAASPACSDKVWPVLDEAVQCYHGDPTYREMLVCMREFVDGKLSAATREALVDRVSFDAVNSRGYIKSYSAEIMAAAAGE